MPHESRNGNTRATRAIVYVKCSLSACIVAFFLVRVPSEDLFSHCIRASYIPFYGLRRTELNGVVKTGCPTAGLLDSIHYTTLEIHFATISYLKKVRPDKDRVISYAAREYGLDKWRAAEGQKSLVDEKLVYLQSTASGQDS